MTTFFISDLHLDPDKPAIISAFYHFLDTIAADPQTESLYILGDFFEVWLGDDDDTTAYIEVRNALRNAADNGLHIFIMHGNRDFLLGKSFCHAAGAQLINDPSIVSIDGQRLLLMHGDSLCTRDLDYIKFRQQVRNEQWQREFTRKPLTERKQYATSMRRQSKNLTQQKTEAIMDVTPDAVEQAFIDNDVTILVHGHTHRPGRHQLTVGERSCERIVLGDWDTYGWYLLAREKQLQLKKFLIE